MKKLLASLLTAASVLLAPAGAGAATEGGIKWDEFPLERLNDMPALQNGARLFVNYCLNCHAAAYVRYNRLRDLGLTEEQIRDNLMFVTDKVGDVMQISTEPRLSKEWFGAVPPDLSLVARSRAVQGQGSGADYLYTYLRSYYRDDTKATGWNNLVFPSVGMPHVLWQLQGERRPLFNKVTSHGETVEVFSGQWEQVTPGQLSPADYDTAVADLVAFMQWMGEPSQGRRVQVGAWVLIFLGVLIVMTWRLNAAYWKDVK